MKIAVLAWSSPIWEPGSLKLASEWSGDGPNLRLEFARISGGRRLTMVLHPEGPEVPTFWALSAYADLIPAMKNLRQREKTVPARIHFASAQDATKKGFDEAVVQAVRSWLDARQGIDAAIWIATAGNFQKRRHAEFSPDEAGAYLSELAHAGTHENAREHLRKVPEQCRTPLWVALMQQSEW